MKKLSVIMALLVIIIGSSCKKNFLDRPPLDTFSDGNYWKTEKEVSTFAWGFYPNYFPGYGSSYTFGKYFSGETLNDDFAPSTPTAFTPLVAPSTNVTTAGVDWDFSYVRKANIFISRVQTVPMADEAKNHWTGIGRFFRALEYNRLVKQYGDVPYYSHSLSETTPDLYKPRDPMVSVLDSMLVDFQYAAANVRTTDPTSGPNGVVVTRSVVLAFMSRVFLYHGTLLKYQSTPNLAKSAQYLQIAQWAANQIMTGAGGTGYSLGTNYRNLFNSLDLTANPEMILFRQYASPLLMHSLVNYVNKEAQTGASKSAIEDYLCSDGLPISLSPLYQGDRTITNTMANRDSRFAATFVNQLRLPGIASNYSTSGYSCLKFLVDDPTLWNTPEALLNTNTTDAPIIRLGEVMLNYAEASAELGTLTQTDLDNTINKLRKRNGINMPALQVLGSSPAVNGIVYDDPKRDPTVPALIWEIRRERRIELMMEGFRNDDLKRWRKYAYLDNNTNPNNNRGAYITKAAYPAATVTLDGGTEGYIVPASKTGSLRVFTDPKYYLSPLPIDQINLYKGMGVTLTQNPGW